MSLITLTIDDDPLDVRDEIVFSKDRCQLHPLSVVHVPVFSGLLNAWTTIFAHHLTLKDAVSEGQAKISAADIDLDAFVDRLTTLLLFICGNDRSAALFVAYFGTTPPHELKRPVLGSELEYVRGWISALKAESNPDLAALGALGETLVANADAAVAALSDARQAQRIFKLTGDYSAFIDQVNSGRKLVYGELSKLPHDPVHKDKHLPGDFADLFFRHESRRNKKVSIASAKEKIAALKDELSEQESLLAKLEAVEAARLQAKQQEAALAAEVAAAEQERAALDKKLAELKAKLKK